MTYIPTKEELIELWFLVVENHSLSWTIMTAKYEWNKNTADSETFLIHVSSDWSMALGNRNHLFPQSLDDIRTLIKLLTPQ